MSFLVSGLPAHILDNFNLIGIRENDTVPLLADCFMHETRRLMAAAERYLLSTAKTLQSL
jgi:hypothetical protein